MQRRPLRVLFYPYVPAAEELVRLIEQDFEAKHPDVDVQPVSVSDYYGGGIGGDEADVYELDTVLLQDLAAAGHLQPLPVALSQTLPAYLPLGRDATQVAGVPYGVPRWLCGNFLFHHAQDGAVAAARTLEDLESALGPRRPPGQGLLVDLKGSSTLGEQYLWGLLHRFGEWPTIEAHIASAVLDPEVLSWLNRLLSLCQRGDCRSQDKHSQAGAYGRQFARRQGRALIGYSEVLHAVLDETSRQCRPEDHCLDTAEIAVSAVPAPGKGQHRTVAWVDALVLNAKCRGACAVDATTLILYLNDRATLAMLLIPSSGRPPRYLLPALSAPYQDEQFTRAAPLYPKLQRLLTGAEVHTGAGLNGNLRVIGRRVDQVLPTP